MTTLKSGQNRPILPMGKLRPGEGHALPESQHGYARKRRLTEAEPPDALPDPVENACPPGKEAHVVDESLIFYEEWELEACVDGALLAKQMDRVNAFPFTYQQLDIFKRKLDKVVHA